MKDTANYLQGIVFISQDPEHTIELALELISEITVISCSALENQNMRGETQVRKKAKDDQKIRDRLCVVCSK